jgi:hypothetical protein
MSSTRLWVRLKAFDHRILDSSTREIVSTAKRTGAQVRGPIPLWKRLDAYSVMEATTPAPTVRPPSRMAKRSFSSMAYSPEGVRSSHPGFVDPRDRLDGEADRRPGPRAHPFRRIRMFWPFM